MYAADGGTHHSSAQGEVVTVDAVGAVNWAYSGKNWGYKITFVFNKNGSIQTGTRISDGGNVALKTSIPPI